MSAGAIQSDTLKALVSHHAIRDVIVGRVKGNNAMWTLSIRLGGPASRLMVVRSRREPVRVWTSLTAIGRFADSIGLKGFSVEL
ncbi:hypothetical protein C9383_07350 [Pseudomonas palleroniana]|uniref:Uncharacterized protein n=1 Tax=Pseudomonas palleroniana TaxID=191390 RepID=A0A1H5MQR5_9PSED|nr:hypothetical protein [Pseudomonas palleroniana]KAB0564280.1 hypothetical protein F7R03_23145 [Pseudomonas palleroniana]PTC29491.1 hypothetical protein C9383_07350 [Pseudomonas palleroniana]SEE91563.1 hypothetical protein SAMN04490198_3514 [Pseudomonas palleroniana]